MQIQSIQFEGQFKAPTEMNLQNGNGKDTHTHGMGEASKQASEQINEREQIRFTVEWKSTSHTYLRR